MHSYDNDSGPCPAAGGRRVAGRDPVKREQILDGAKRCFLSVGFEQASVSDITAEAGVSKGTIYVYFDGKDDLFAALIQRERARLLDFAQQELDTATTVRDALSRFGVVLATRLTSDEVIRAQRMVLAAAGRLPGLAAEFCGAEPFSGQAILKAYLDKKVAAGELTIADTDLAARQYIELSMAGIFRRRLFGTMPEEASAQDIARVVGQAVEIFFGFYSPKPPVESASP